MCAISSSTPRARKTYEGSRLALVQALPLLTAKSCSQIESDTVCSNCGIVVCLQGTMCSYYTICPHHTLLSSKDCHYTVYALAHFSIPGTVRHAGLCAAGKADSNSLVCCKCLNTTSSMHQSVHTHQLQVLESDHTHQVQTVKSDHEHRLLTFKSDHTHQLQT